MAFYETIWNFLMIYIFGVPLGDGALIWENWDLFFNFQAGSDGRLILAPIFSLGDLWPWVASHFLTMLACVSLCVMLWKLITLPIRYFANRVK